MPEEKDEVAKEEFYSSSEKVFDAVLNYDTKIILGDFNAEVGKDKGKLMVKDALGRDLAVTGKWYQRKDIHKVT
jgi:hypothetical protein